MQSLCHRTISCRTKAGGDQYGQGLRSASYTPNSLNQYTSRTVPSGFDMVGVANKDATVRVDGNDVQYRRGEYWRQYVSVDNEGAPVWRSVSVTTTGGGSATGGVFVPKTAEVFVHDLDGNLTSDGRWTYVWDGENRLTQMTANTTVGPRYQINFEYDWKGRRIRKTVTNLATSTVILDTKFLYNEWNLLVELNGANNAVLRSYVWGPDLSGSLHGAGGVGGLLKIKDATQGTHFAVYDLNGNVMGLVNAANGTISAQYEYGPFGELIRATGPMAKLNPFRFSTKYQDDETDLLYYGYRYYNSSTGRFINQDPIEEKGGKNLYGFVGNCPQNSFDSLGLLKFDGCTPTEQAELQEQFSTYCKKINDNGFRCCLGHFNIPQRLGGICADNNEITIKCIHEYGGSCDKGTCSWSFPGSRVIRMCPDGLAKVGGCADPYGCNLMHEMVHMSGHGFEKWPKKVARCLGCQYWN